MLLKLPFGDNSALYTPSSWYDQLTVHNVRPHLPINMLIDLRSVLENGWNTNKELRPTADHILNILNIFNDLSNNANEPPIK